MFALDIKALATNLAFIKRAASFSAASSRGLEAVNAVRLVVVDGVATISFFDYATSVSVRMPATGEDGTVIVGMVDLVAGVKAAGGKGVASFEVAGDVVTLSMPDGLSVSIPLTSTKAVDQLPTLPTVEGVEPALIVDGAQLASTAQVLAVSVGKDDTLPMLMGVRVESVDGEVVAASTDRFKLSVSEVANACKSDDFAALLPGKAMLAFAKFAAKDEVVSLRLSDSHAELAGDTVSMVLRLVDAQFPKFRQLMPAEDALETGFTVDAGAFATRVKALAAVAPYVHFDVSEDAVRVSGIAHGVDQRVVSSFVADAGEISAPSTTAMRFDAGYIANVLASAPKGVKVRFGMTKATRPAV